MNKYIDHLTINEYETLIRLLKKYESFENQKMLETGNKKDYIENRFLVIKMQQIIKKYKK